MTKINSINQTNQYKKPLLNPKNTGIAAGVAMTIMTLRAFSNNKSIKKHHKLFGYITTGLTLLHIGTLEYLHHKYKKM